MSTTTADLFDIELDSDLGSSEDEYASEDESEDDSGEEEPESESDEYLDDLEDSAAFMLVQSTRPYSSSSMMALHGLMLISSEAHKIVNSLKRRREDAFEEEEDDERENGGCYDNDDWSMPSSMSTVTAKRERAKSIRDYAEECISAHLQCTIFRHRRDNEQLVVKQCLREQDGLWRSGTKSSFLQGQDSEIRYSPYSPSSSSSSSWTYNM
ncbi:hypothetical protein BGZ83_010013 [Gryganskiella cystojenkinii]|nr:hypothetical protein BGZ83_010013 [Gryganskiella cystojenkinii]